MADISDVFDRLFARSETHRYGPYSRIEEPVELISETQYRIKVRDKLNRNLTVQLYRKLGDLGGQLWGQELRSLLQLNSIEHPALPKITNGAYDERDDLAFIVTETAQFDLTHPKALPLLRNDRDRLIQQFASLADGLARLHGRGLIHRNLWPGAIEIAFEGSGELRQFQLRIARFEMSVLLSNLLRRVAFGDHHYEEARRSLAGQDASALAYMPPERLGFFYKNAQREAIESDRSDVYSLGVMAYEWFVGDLPPVVRQTSGALPENAPPEWTRDLRKHLMSGIGVSGLNTRFQNLLRGMLTDHPQDRRTSYEVAQDLNRNFDLYVSQWSIRDKDADRVVIYMPDKFHDTVRTWQWIVHDPSTIEGRAELAAFLKHELKSARLFYSPTGAIRYVEMGTPAARQEARYVLVGRRAAWFCALYRHHDPFDNTLGPEQPTMLLIKYPCPLERATTLQERSQRGRLAPPFELVPIGFDEEYVTKCASLPSWTGIYDSLAADTRVDPIRERYEAPIDWLLDYESTKLAARAFPYMWNGEKTGSAITLEFDRDRDEARLNEARTGMPRFHAKDKRRRPSFGDFFDGEQDQDGIRRVTLVGDAESGQRSTSVDGHFIAKIDSTTISVRLTKNEKPAKRGLIQPHTDRGTRTALSRQREVREEFLESRGLLSQLRKPWTIPGPRRRWHHVGKELRGGVHEILKDMLSSEPFYALHGPPGTGKTTALAHALTAYLKVEPQARILVAAQSNYALDNLAEAITKRLHTEWQSVSGGPTNLPLCVRITSEFSEDKVAKTIQPYTLENRVSSLQRTIANNCAEQIRGANLTPALREIVRKWQEQLPQATPELRQRVRRGANLVFATCLGSTRKNIDAVGDFGVYDLVVIEEAAKAWITELALPLVRGRRWIVVGDYLQLPAFRVDDTKEFLRLCGTSDDPALGVHAANYEQYEEVFDFFERMFVDKLGNPLTEDSDGGWRRATGMLTTQFRMHPNIGELVSRNFYDRKLASDESTRRDHGIEFPRSFAGHSMVWLDTGASHPSHNINSFEDSPCWNNPDEARAVAQVIRELSPQPSPKDYVVLTPYREQVDQLISAGIPAANVHTVHSFQGREARIVFVSMVRSRFRAGDDPRKNIGHLTKPELANVMFSRARELLVIVGRFQHFAAEKQSFWPMLCEDFAELGVVIPLAACLEGARP